MPRPVPAVVVPAVLLTALLLCGLAGILVGAGNLPAGAALSALFDRAAAPADDALVVWDLRIPRTALALAVGAALGLSGALLQGHTRNPLADPGLLGLSAGAALAVVLSATLLGLTSPSQYVWFAFAGAAVGAIAVVAVTSAGSSPSPLTLLLAGAGLTASLTAVTTALVLTDRVGLDAHRFWAAGSVAGRDLGVLADLAPFLAVGAVLALGSGRALSILALGPDAARSLGVRPGLSLAVGVLAVVLLTGASTAAAGPIGFVGLVVPHLARTLVGHDHRRVLPASALLGAVLVCGADTLGRVIASPREVQVGVLLGLLGGPVFLVLVRRRWATTKVGQK